MWRGPTRWMPQRKQSHVPTQNAFVILGVFFAGAATVQAGEKPQHSLRPDGLEGGRSVTKRSRKNLFSFRANQTRQEGHYGKKATCKQEKEGGKGGFERERERRGQLLLIHNNQRDLPAFPGCLGFKALSVFPTLGFQDVARKKASCILQHVLQTPISSFAFGLQLGIGEQRAANICPCTGMQSTLRQSSPPLPGS